MECWWIGEEKGDAPAMLKGMQSSCVHFEETSTFVFHSTPCNQVWLGLPQVTGSSLAPSLQQWRRGQGKLVWARVFWMVESAGNVRKSWDVSHWVILWTIPCGYEGWCGVVEESNRLTALLLYQKSIGPTSYEKNDIRTTPSLLLDPSTRHTTPHIHEEWWPEDDPVWNVQWFMDISSKFYHPQQNPKYHCSRLEL